MQIFELVFIVCFLLAIIASMRVIWLVHGGRYAAARRNFTYVSAFIVSYLAIVVAVALLAPRQVYQIGETRCFDDWCISVVSAKAADAIGNTQPLRGRFLLVTLRVSSRARRMRQSEPSTIVYLLDAEGKEYDVAAGPQQAFEARNGAQPPIGAVLDPGDSITTVRVFDIPANLTEIGLATRQIGAYDPAIFVIGDDESLFHRPAIFRIPMTSQP